MPNKLEKLTINRADLVDRPSNPLARVVLFKRESVEKNLYDATTTNGVLAAQDFMEAYYRTMNAFRDSMSGLMYTSELDDTARVSKMKTSIKEAASALTKLMDTYPYQKTEESENDEILAKIEKTVDVLQELDTLVSSGEISVQEITETLEGLEMADKKTEVNEVEALKAEVAAKATALETAGTEIAKAQAEIAELKKAAAATKEPEVEDIWKGVNPAIRAQFEELSKRADESAKIAKEAEETSAMVKLTKRVTEELNGIVGTIDEKAALLRSIEKVAGQKLFEKMYVMLKSASEAVKASEIVKEKGHTGSVSTGNTVIEKMKARAKTMLDSGKATSEAAAMAEIARQDPSLYKEYLMEEAN